jgi:uncharacterized HAD superfamily protein
VFEYSKSYKLLFLFCVMDEKDVIAVDADMVLFNYVGEFCDWHNKRHGTDWSLSDISLYDVAAVFGLSADELQARFDVFNADNLANLFPIDGAKEALTELALKHKLVCVSSRPLKTREATLVSLSKHFPDIFSDLHLTGQSLNLSKVHEITKGTLCRDLGVKHMIEDGLEHALEIRKTSPNTQVWLFGNYAWNKPKDKLPEGIHVAYTWGDVAGGILGA